MKGTRFAATHALLIVDVQRDFLPGGPLGVPGGHEIVTPIAELTRDFDMVVFTQDFHPPRHISFASTHGRRPFEVLELPTRRGHRRHQLLWPDHCVAGTPGAMLPEGLPDERITLVLRKGTRADVDSYSAFREQHDRTGRRRTTGLGAWLHARGVRGVYIVGLARDYCVSATAIDAASEGFTVTVFDELTRAVAPAAKHETDRTLACAGVCVAEHA
jgi:nicotinamidase/pyrazinamidase